MKPEDVTDEIVDAAFLAHSQKPYGPSRPRMKRAIAAAINVMPPDPGLARLREENKKLRGENAVLLDLLGDAACVIRSIEPEDSDEAEQLREMPDAIDRAAAEKNKHTPGPWKVGFVTDFLNQTATEPSVGCAYGVDEEVRANACLMAAAPELLKALQDLLTGGSGMTGSEYTQVIENAKSLISKVNGD